MSPMHRLLFSAEYSVCVLMYDIILILELLLHFVCVGVDVVLCEWAYGECMHGYATIY